MPHLRLEYPSALTDRVEMTTFCRYMNAAMQETGLFPLAGIRVRGHAADCVSVADDGAAILFLHFLHMELMIGAGRRDDEKHTAVESLYAAAQAFLEPRLEGAPFALSLELRELSPFAQKRWNTIRDAIGSA